MAVTVVQKAKNGSSGTVASLTATFSSNVTAGNLLVCSLSLNGAATTPTITITDPNNTWTRATNYWDSNGYGGEIWYCANCVGGHADAVTANTTSNKVMDLYIYEVGGCATSSPLDVAATPTHNTSGFAVGSNMTGLVSSTDWAIYGCAGNNVPLSSISGWTVDKASTNNMSAAYQTASSTTVTAPTMISSSGFFAVVGASFKPAPSFISGTVTIAVGPFTVNTSGGLLIAATATVTIGPFTVAATTGQVSGCVRAGWLTLGALTVPFENPTAGYFCTSLDVGYPTVRDVVTNRPDATGAIDRTKYFGTRVVTVAIMAITGAGASIDDVAALFAPFMDPAVRPVLHYALDRAGHPQRMLTVRAAGYSWPVAGPYQRDIQLQFVAADPVAYDPQLQTVTVAPGNTGVVASQGDLSVFPLLRVWGPVTGPSVTVTPPAGPAWQLKFLAAFAVAAGHFVDIDTAARTVYLDGDPAQGRLASLDWTVSSWQWIAARTSATLTVAGTATSPTTQVVASWRDGYLS